MGRSRPFYTQQTSLQKVDVAVGGALDLPTMGSPITSASVIKESCDVET
jgi:hypothetical protein